MSELHTCPDCRCRFVQPFKCTTCGAQKLYDETVRSQAAEIERLTRENTELLRAAREWQEDARPCWMVERDRLRVALDWYALNLGASKSKDMRIIVQDGGARAREALIGEPKP